MRSFAIEEPGSLVPALYATLGIPKAKQMKMLTQNVDQRVTFTSSFEVTYSGADKGRL